MKKIFLAKHTRFSETIRKLAIGIFFLSLFMLSLEFFNLSSDAVFASASDKVEMEAEAVEETIITSPSPEMLDHAREAVGKFQTPSPPTRFSDIQGKAADIVHDKVCGDGGTAANAGQACDSMNPVLYEQGGEDDNHSVRNKQLNQTEDRPAGHPENHPVRPELEDKTAPVYYFFSFSMPPESIRIAVQDAYELRQKGINVVMVIRGFVNNDLRATALAFENLMRESGINSNLPVDIDPPLYEQYGVNEVPVIVSTSRKGKGRITGDVGIPYALSRFDKAREDHGKMGNTYEIAEEDLMKLIAAKQSIIEEKLRQRIETVKKGMYVLKKYDGKYEKAVTDRVYYVDPSIVLTEDINDHEGNVLFPKGSTFNPTNHVRLGRYIVIDGNDPEQIRLAMAGDYRKIMIISGDLAKLTAKHRKRFWFVPDDILKRFQIRRVPVIFEQEGKHVRITEKAM